MLRNVLRASGSVTLAPGALQIELLLLQATLALRAIVDCVVSL